MVEMRNNSQEKNETPEIITVSMILEDLENGEDRNAIKAKYNLQAWEVKQMFEHPSLKGKKAKRVKKLSFDFVDDTVDENQIDLEDAIEEELNGRRQMDAEDQLQETMDEDELDEFITDEIGREVIDEAKGDLLEYARTESEVLDNICTEHEEVSDLREELGMEPLPPLNDRIKVVDSIGKFDELSGEEMESKADDWANETNY